MRSTQQQARHAGVLYILVALTAPLGLLYVPAKLIVSGNATATADNIRASAWLLRAGIASELVCQVLAVFLVLALYQLFKPVHEGWARQVVIFGALLSVPIMFVNVLNNVAALTLLSGAAFLSAFDAPQLDALSYLFVQLHDQGVVVASVFWGLWLLPFGLLVVRCGFIPSLLGYLLLVAGIGYLISAGVTLVLPQFAPAVSAVVQPLQFGELPIIFWLLIRGARTTRPGATAATSAATS